MKTIRLHKKFHLNEGADLNASVEYNRPNLDPAPTPAMQDLFFYKFKKKNTVLKNEEKY